MPTRIACTPRGRARLSSARRTRRRGEPERAQLVAAAERVADRLGHRFRALGVAADGCSAGGLVHRRVRGGDDGRTAGHRLGDRHPEALESRRVDDRGGAPVERGELLVGHAAEAHDPGRSSSGCSPQPAPPTTASSSSGVGESENASTSVPRFLRGSSVATVSRYGASARRGPVGVVLGRDPGMRHDDPFAREAEAHGDIVGGEGRVGEDHAAGRRRVRVLAGVHRVRPPGHPLRVVERHEVVNRRRAQARLLGRVHPVGEVEDVEVAEPALGRRPAGPRPGRAPGVRADSVSAAARAGSRRAPPGSLASRRRGRRERDDRVARLLSCVGQPTQRAEDVVVHARPLVRERRDVEGDPHGL